MFVGKKDFKMKFLLLVLLLSMIFLANCDDCIDTCDCNINYVSCYFLSRFPSFRSTNWINSLYIYSSDIEFIEVYENNYEELERLVLTNCRFVRCSEIERISRTRPRVRFQFSEVCVDDPATTVSFFCNYHNEKQYFKTN